MELSSVDLNQLIAFVFAVGMFILYSNFVFVLTTVTTKHVERKIGKSGK